MNHTVVDFETFYDTKNGISTALQGVENYVRTQDAYIVSIVDDEFEFCGTIEQTSAAFNDSFWKDLNRQFWAANSNFDQTWEEKYWPAAVHPWQCALDLAKGNQLPADLANLARVLLGAGKVDKTLRDKMNGVRFESLPESEQQAMIGYCLNDSVRTKQMIGMMKPLSPIETRIAALTRLQNRRGVYIDKDRVEKDMTTLHKIRHSAMRHIPWRTDCNGEEGLLSHKRLGKWCDAQNIPCPDSIAKTDLDCIELMKLHPALAEVLMWMRKFRTAGTLIEKGRTLLERLTPDGRLPLDLLYCGAPHTRRWSCQGWNIQNLAKEEFFGEIVYCNEGDENAKEFTWGGKKVWVDMKKSEWIYLRNWIIPKAGKKFLIFDYSQIEPRCLHWLAGDDDFLNMVRAGYGLYEAHAVTAKGWKGKPGTLKKENLLFYTSVKSELLGLGYGMGARKYRDKAESDDKIVLTDEQALAIVKGFRAQKPKITGLWGKLDSLMKQAVLSNDKHLLIEMPTGDVMHHFHLRQTAKVTEDGQTRSSYMSSKTRGVFDERGVVRNLWGGTLTENVTQRMARDVFAEGMLRAEDNAFLARFSAHDEGVFEVDDGNEKFLKDQKAELERVLVQPPAWCPDVPLAVEGSYEERYTK